MPLPLLLALTPLPSDSFVPFVQPPAAGVVDSELLGTGEVETFDSEARAALLARELPRVWSGTYQPYGGTTSLPVQLQLDSLVAVGQLVDLRGQMSIGGVATPVQGNLNAKSDQLDLLLLGETLPAGLEPGGAVLGLEGFSLSAWEPSRLVSPGGRLQLAPQQAAPAAAPTAAPQIRGLW